MWIVAYHVINGKPVQCTYKFKMLPCNFFHMLFFYDAIIMQMEQFKVQINTRTNICRNRSRLALIPVVASVTHSAFYSNDEIEHHNFWGEISVNVNWNVML